MSEEFDLARFKEAQDSVYHRVKSELTKGHKQTHWIWYVFPQIDGLGRSYTAKKYAIKNIEEAKCYLKEPLLAGRLFECCQILLNIQNKTAAQILGHPDDLKLHSCATLFAYVSEPESVFQQIINKYYGGEFDRLTLDIIAR